ncbi:Pospholipid-transporting ATPase [Spironucleus salmonicida]|uniref:Pospholipid-transporting ATPase n=1 Tax=Spironucleus salmonicida TaxID=348837 RepID=A0A9P8LLL5_9EUKA|nr:Pospholipid-transporting ATPase [Spironucleus salmonicida]
MVSNKPIKKKGKNVALLVQQQPQKVEINFYDPLNAKNNLISSCKYRWWNFIFLFLYQQYQKPSNVFYLVQAMSNLIPGAAVVTPATAFLPVIFVLLIAAAREILEDLGRYKADKQANSQMYKIMRDGQQVQICSSDIKQGDILFLMNTQEVPADSVLLYSYDESRIGFISTASLDGESNLKIRNQVLPFTLISKAHDDVAQVFSNFFGRVTVQPPSNDMHKFNGKLFVSQDVPVKDIQSNTDSNQHITDQNNLHFEYDINFQMDNVLLRGVRIQNTQEVIAAVVYTAKDTRLMQNQLPSKNKTSRLDTRINFLILLITILALCLIVSFAVIGYTVNFDGFAYSAETNGPIKAGQRFVQYLIICSYLLPISLFVTIEVVRFLQSILIDLDKKLRRKDILEWQERNVGTPISKSPFYNESAVQHSVQVRNSIAVENLAEVDIIFSDKTGTLTKNQMTFHSFIDKRNTVYDVSKAMKNKVCPIKDIDQAAKFSFALCNTVLPQIENNAIVYQAESPDEISFVEVANHFGLQFKLKHSKAIFFEYNYQGKTISLQYEVLAVVPFSSARKKMSIVLREIGSVLLSDLTAFSQFVSAGAVYCTPQEIALPGETFVLSKGADSFIMPYMDIYQAPEFYAQVQVNVDNFSKFGLRTLAFGSKRLGGACQWLEQWDQVKLLPEEDGRYEALTGELERDLVFQCVSAIEDELQDDLQETLTSLLAAGIKVWMLTGDKTLTAVNIAKAAGLAQADSQFIYLTAEAYADAVKGATQNTQKQQEKQTLNQLIDHGVQLQTEHLTEAQKKGYFAQLAMLYEITTKNESKVMSYMKSIFNKQVVQEETVPITVVLDTDMFKLLIKHNLQYKFFHIAVFCSSVVCCRLSPQEKALIVNLAHQYKPYLTTLSIGDGANDVVMIKTAQIGVGVAGREGLHACNSADISIPQFSFLKRVIFVHGRISHFRNSQLVDYCIYKNSMLTFVNLTYAFFSKVSGNIVTESLLLMVFNTFMTFIPITGYSLMEKDAYDIDLMNYPQGLKYFNKKYSPNIYSVISSLLYSFICSQIVFHMLMFIYNYGIVYNNGFNGDLYTFQLWIMGSICIIAIIRVYIITQFWNWFVFILLIFSFIVFWICYLIGNYFTGFGIGLYGQLYLIANSLSRIITFILATFISTLIGFLGQAIQRIWLPYNSDILLHKHQKDCKKMDELNLDSIDLKYDYALKLINQ